MKNLFILFMCFTVISCSTLKKDKNNLVGEGAADVSSQDIDSDNKGSDSGTIEGLSTVYFAYDSSVLSEESKETLMEDLDWLQSHSEVKNMELEGHCDTMGSEAYNIGLGRRRAESVRSFLMEKGIEENRLSVISYGEERPFSEIDHFKNRRVNFVPIY